MPQKIVETPYPLIDADPHASRVVRYFRASDYGAWAAAIAAFPSALYLWGTSRSGPIGEPVLIQFLRGSVEMADPSRLRMKTGLRLGGFLGFIGGFMVAYQRSSCEYPYEGAC